MSRELQINYGPIQVGGPSTEYLLDGYHGIERRDGTGASSIRFDVVVSVASEAALGAACFKLETAFRTPRLDLNVSQSGAALLTISHSTASGGFNTEPSIEKAGQVGDTGRSRRYTCSVEWESPADHSSGLRESSVNVDYDEARIRTVTIAGTYTATSSATARSKYESAIAAHASSTLSALSVSVSEIVGEPTTEHDYANKVIRFERVYREIIFGQGQNTANNSNSIVSQTLTVARREASEDRYPGEDVSALATFDIHYEAWIDKDNSTDLSGEYDNLRDWLINQLSDLFSAGSFALVSERPEYDRPRNRIIADLVAQGQVTETKYTRRTVTIEDRIEEPIVFRGAHSGDPLAHYKYQGFTVALRVVTENSQQSGNVPQVVAMRDAVTFAQQFTDPPFGIVVNGSWDIIARSAAVSPIQKGIQGSGSTLDLSETVSVVTMRYTTRPQSNAGGTSARPPVNTGPSPISGGSSPRAVFS